MYAHQSNSDDDFYAMYESNIKIDTDFLFKLWFCGPYDWIRDTGLALLFKSDNDE